MKKQIKNARQHFGSDLSFETVLKAFNEGTPLFDREGTAIKSELQLAQHDTDSLQVEVASQSVDLTASMVRSNSKPCGVCGKALIDSQLSNSHRILYCQSCHHTDWPAEANVAAQPTPTTERRRIKLDCTNGVCRMIES